MAAPEIKGRFVASTLVAREFLRNADRASRPLRILQAIKLTFLAHGWSFVNLETPLVSEDVYAWKHGPVYPELYHATKRFGDDPITWVPESIREQEAKTELKEREKILIEAVYNRYKEFSGVDLMNLTHEDGTPWHATWQVSAGGVIGNELIRDFYVGKAKESSND